MKKERRMDMMKAFSSEFLREMNFKANLIRKAEGVRKVNNLKYNALVKKYNAEYRKLYLLPIKELKVLVEELGEG
jgi:hypothetical protein